MPRILNDPFRVTLWIALREILDAVIARDFERQVRGWKFFPASLVALSSSQRFKVSREKLTGRLENFRHGRRVTRRRWCPEDDNGEEWMTEEVHEHQKV